jgi:Protein of unknown function (DUF2783)
MLTDQELDEVYTRACYAMTELGEAKQPLFLARLALLLMKEVGDAGLIRGAIEDARAVDRAA